MQNDEPSAHVPFLQRPEQQPPAPPLVAVQGLPAVRQVVLRGWHLLPVQVPLQHDAEVVQVALSAVQLVALAQTRRAVSHWRLQQSVFTAQVLPAPPQVVIREAQVCETGSHDCEQHWASVAHAAPTTVQATPPPAPAAALPPAPAPPPVPARPPPPPCPPAAPLPAAPRAPAEPLIPAPPATPA
jgi:hypothetical protein